MNSWVRKPPKRRQPFFCFDIETAPQGWARSMDLELDMRQLHEGWIKLWYHQDCTPTETCPFNKVTEEVREMGFVNGFNHWVDWLREEAQAPLLATGVAPALHPTSAHIVSVSFGFKRDKTDQVIVYRLFDDDGGPLYEKTQAEIMMREMGFLGVIIGELAVAIQNGCVIVSWNGKDFDLPMILGRSMLLGMDSDVTDIHWSRLLYPYDNKDHADMRLIINGDQRNSRGTLDWFSKAANIPAATHGADVFKWVVEGEWAKLTEYGEEEAYTMINWWRRIRDWR